MPIDKDGFMNTPQKFASALTYAKRYAFCNAFGILTADEDDDTAKTFEVKTSENEGLDTITKAKKEFLEKQGVDTTGMSKEEIEKKFLEVKNQKIK